MQNEESQSLKMHSDFKKSQKTNIRMKIFVIYLFVFINIITLKFKIYKNPFHSLNTSLLKNITEKKGSKNHDFKNNTFYAEKKIINNTTNLIIEIKNDIKPNLNNFNESNLTFTNDKNLLALFEDKYFSISNMRYSSSYKYDIAKVEYNIGIYDKDQKLIYPSDLSLYNNLQVFCFCKMSNNIKIYSLPGIEQNSNYKCVELFKFKEKPNFGIKIVDRKGFKGKFEIPHVKRNIAQNCAHSGKHGVNSQLFGFHGRAPKKLKES